MDCYYDGNNFVLTNKISSRCVLWRVSRIFPRFECALLHVLAWFIICLCITKKQAHTSEIIWTYEREFCWQTIQNIQFFKTNFEKAGSADREETQIKLE